MNDKAQATFFLYFMLGVLVIVLSYSLAPSITQVANETRTEMDCNNESISDWTKGSCAINDVTPVYWIIALLAFAGIIIGGSKL